MSTTSTVSAAAPATAATTTVGAVYTICPVLSGAAVAAELGWLDEEFKKAGYGLTYLSALPGRVDRLPHFHHRLPNLFRDGGNIPSIWAKADHVDTKVVGLTWSPNAGKIVVRTDSGIRRLVDLKGRRFGLPASVNKEKVDFRRGTAERGIEVALALFGLSRKDVQIVDLPYDDPQSTVHFAKPSALWAGRTQQNVLPPVDVAALSEGKVEAIFVHHGAAASLVETGRFTVIEDLDRHPDWTLRVANSPWAITVNTDFAEQHPAAVVAFLRAAIRAGRWVNADRAAAGEILRRVSFAGDAAQASAAAAGIDFVPNLSAQNIAGLAIEKDFLRSHGYIKNDIDIQKWVDGRYLEEALRSL